MGKVGLVVRLTVYFDRLNVNILFAHFGGKYCKCLSVSQMQLHLREQGSTDFILSADRIDRIESHCAEYVPGRHLSTVFVSAKTGRLPAFYWPDFNADTQHRGFFGFDKEEGLKYILISEKGCADPSTEYSLELTDGLLPLDTHTFDKDALIIENEQIHKVTLYTKEKKAYLSLHFHAPVVGLWSPPAKNAPFVCIEPWYGRCDRAHYTGEYKDKGWMQHLQPKETFKGGYTIEINE